MAKDHGIPDSNFKPSQALIDFSTNNPFAWEGSSTLGAGYVQIVDNSGTPIVSFGGGTQYTDAGTPPTHPIGNALVFDNGSSAWQAVNSTHGLPVNILNPSIAVTGTFWQATQPVSGTITANAGTNLNTSLLALESGGNLATLAGIVSSAKAAVKTADGDQVTLGSKADAKSTATDTTSISIMSVLKQISASVQAPPSQAVTNAGTFAVQATLQTQTDTVMIGGVNIKEINAVTPLMGNGGTGTGSQRVTLASDNTGIANWGQGATGASVPSGATYGGRIAKTALPTAVSDAQLVGGMADKFGRQVTLLGTIRDLVGTQTTTISASTSETTIVTAAALVFNDIVMLIISNTSTATNTRIDFRDTTAGSVLFSLQSNGGQPPIGFALGGFAIPQTSVNTNWTAQCATSTTDIRVYAVYQKNK